MEYARASRRRWDKGSMLLPEIDDVRHAAVRAGARAPPPPGHGPVAAAGHPGPGDRRAGCMAVPAGGLGLLPHRRLWPAGQRHSAVAQPSQRCAAVRAGVRRHAAVDGVGIGQRLLALGATAGAGHRAGHRSGAADADVARAAVQTAVVQHRRRVAAGVRRRVCPGVQSARQRGRPCAVPGSSLQRRPGADPRHHRPAAGRPARRG